MSKPLLNRGFRLRTAGVAPRRELLHGVEHLVVPVVALMEGVIHAINAATPEFVSAALLRSCAHTWNGRPLVVGHPTIDGEQVSANDPTILSERGFGVIFASHVDGTKMALEAWVNPARLETLQQHALLADIRAGKPIEVSVGAFVAALAEAGTFGGRAYKARWTAAIGDHLAFLPGGRGACSIEMGCGACRAASAAIPTYEIRDDELNEFTADDIKAIAVVPRRSRMAKDNKGLKPRGLRDKLIAFASTLRAANDTPEQAASEEAAELVGYHALRNFLDQIGNAWDDASGIVDDLIADETDNPSATPAQEEAEEEVETARLDALCALLSSIVSQSYGAQGIAYKLNMPDLPEPADPRYMSALRAAIGKTISAKSAKMIQDAHDASHTMHDRTTALGADCNGMKLLSGRPGGATDSEGDIMKKTEIIKALTACTCSGFKAADEPFLATLSEERLTEMHAAAELRATELRTATEAKTALDAKIVEIEAKLTAASAKPATLTEAQVLEQFPALKTLVDNAAAATAAEKTQLVTQLKAAASGVYSEAELNALDVPALHKIASLTKVDVKDYSGRGLPLDRTAGAAGLDAFKAPDPYALDKQ